MAIAPTINLNMELNYTFALSSTSLWRGEVVVVNASGAPFDTIDVSSEIQFSIRRSYGSPAVAILSNGNGIEVSAANSSIKINITRESVSALAIETDVSEWVYDLDLIDNQNNHYRLMKGVLLTYGDV